MRRNVFTRGRAQPPRARGRGRLGGRARGHVAAPHALLHPLGRQPPDALRHGGRGAAGPLRRRVAADRDAHGGGARASGCCSGHPVRAIGHGPDGVVVRADGAEVRARRAVVAVRADARRPDRLRPAAARLSRPAHPADAARHRGQVHGDLRGALLARRRPVRRGHERRRAGAAHVRQLAAGRLARRAARLPRGPPRAAARAAAGRRSAEPPWWTASRGCSDRVPQGPTPTWSGSGPRRSGRAAATAATARPAPGPTTGPRCASRSGRSTGPARRSRRCGTATWTARCAPGRARPPMCSSGLV